MSVTVKYNGNTLAELSESGTKTLKTSGKYCEGDITVENAKDGIEQEEYTFDQRRAEVKSYLENVGYDPADYTVSQIANYVTTPSANYPLGVTISIKSAGTLTIIDGYTGRTISHEVAAGDFTIYNCTPAAESKFFLADGNGDIIQIGVVIPSGACRMIYAPNIDNMRDLGGWDCDGGKIKYGLLFRGGEPYQLVTTAGKKICLDFLGIEKEINLRFASELNGRIESGFGASVDMIHVDMTWEALPYQKTSGNIKAIFDPLFDFAIAGKPTLFHCSAGADRTGVVALLCEAVLGVAQSDIDKDYELTSFYTGASTDAEARRRNEAAWTREINYINTYAGATFRDKVVNFLLSCGITIEKINAFRAAMIDGTPATLTADISTYTVTRTLSGVSSDNADTAAKQYQPFAATLTPESGKVIGGISVTMGGVDITSRVFSGDDTVLRRKVSKNLSHVLSSNNRSYAHDGQSFASELSAEDGYDMGSVTITMGGADMSAYYKNGIISIPEVTGDIVITATAIEQAPAYINLLDNAIDMDGNVIGRTPMYSNMRFNSASGAPVSNSGTNITGLIPVHPGDTMRIRWSGDSDGSYQCIKAYKSDKSQVEAGYLSFSNIAAKAAASVIQQDFANGVFDFTFKTSYGSINGMAYIAVQLIGDISDAIITVNEEIV